MQFKTTCNKQFLFRGLLQKKIILLAVLLTALLTRTSAQIQIFTDRASWEAALAGPSTSIDLSTVNADVSLCPVGTTVTAGAATFSSTSCSVSNIFLDVPPVGNGYLSGVKQLTFSGTGSGSPRAAVSIPASNGIGFDWQSSATSGSGSANSMFVRVVSASGTTTQRLNGTTTTGFIGIVDPCGGMTSFEVYSSQTNFQSFAAANFSYAEVPFLKPEIDVRGNSISIVDGSTTTSPGDNTNLGSVSTSGGSVSKIFEIHNTGTANLVVSNILKAGASSSLFQISGITYPATVAPGNSTSFTVTFTPTATGSRSAELQVINDDCDEALFNFAIQACLPTVATANYTVNQDAGTNVYSSGSCNSLVATVTPSGAQPVSGTVTAKVTIDGSVQFFGGEPYVTRHYDIEPATNPSTATATLVLYYTQAEFTAYNTAKPGTTYDLPTGPSDAAGISHLRLTQSHGTSNTSLPGSYTGYTGPGPVNVILTPGSVIWNSTASRWEVTVTVTGFSGFFATGNIGVALPLQLTSFTARKDGSRVVLNWQVAREAGNTVYEVMRSTDGNLFRSIGNLPGKGGDQQYAYYDEQPAGGVNYYRIQIKEPGEDDVYSSLQTIRNSNDGSGRVTLAPVPADGQLTVRNSESSLNGQPAVIYDVHGREMLRFTMQAVSEINVASWKAGVYRLRLPDGSVLRILKQ